MIKQKTEWKKGWRKMSDQRSGGGMVPKGIQRKNDQNRVVGEQQGEGDERKMGEGETGTENGPEGKQNG